jgi:hypothetical protein
VNCLGSVFPTALAASALADKVFGEGRWGGPQLAEIEAVLGRLIRDGRVHVVGPDSGEPRS